MSEHPERTVPRSIVVTTYRLRRAAGRVEFSRNPAPPPPVVPLSRPAEVARMLALAHHLEAAIESGKFKSRTEVAQRLGIVDSRVTQILSLCHLAPDIQEDVVFFEVTGGAELLTETELRKVSRLLDWDEQRRAYARMRPGFGERLGNSDADDIAAE
jgi:hypothetical protein